MKALKKRNSPLYLSLPRPPRRSQVGPLRGASIIWWDCGVNELKIWELLGPEGQLGRSPDSDLCAALQPGPALPRSLSHWEMSRVSHVLTMLSEFVRCEAR